MTWFLGPISWCTKSIFICQNSSPSLIARAPLIWSHWRRERTRLRSRSPTSLSSSGFIQGQSICDPPSSQSIHSACSLTASQYLAICRAWLSRSCFDSLVLTTYFVAAFAHANIFNGNLKHSSQLKSITDSKQLSTSLVCRCHSLAVGKALPRSRTQHLLVDLGCTMFSSSSSSSSFKANPSVILLLSNPNMHVD